MIACARVSVHACVYVHVHGCVSVGGGGGGVMHVCMHTHHDMCVCM